MQRSWVRLAWIAALVMVLAACNAVPGGAGSDDAPAATGGDGPGEWAANASVHRDEVGEQFEYRCAPGGTLRTVWGTDIYTDDSSVCTAAVHAGVITLATGGTVTIEMRPGEESYEGSERNGVTTNNYGAWHGSFIFPEDD